jgi:hypothetical protein
VPASQDLGAWFKLQRLTLDAVHASWIADIAPEIVREMRSSLLGRRWLAIRLSTASPVLFGGPAQIQPAQAGQLQSAAWLAAPLADLTNCALELGSLALAGMVRTVVARADVMRLRGLLGSVRYERILKGPPDPLSRTRPGADAGAANSGDDVVERLMRRGAAELMGYAAGVHSAWGESVKLRFERGISEVAPAPTLEPNAAEDCLRACAAAAEPALCGIA